MQLNEEPKHFFWGCLWPCPEAPTLTSTVSRVIQPKLQGGGHVLSVFGGAEVTVLCRAPAATARCLYAAHGAPATRGTHPNHLHPHARNSVRRISLFCPLRRSACAGRWWSRTTRRWRARWTGWRRQLAVVAATRCCRSLLRTRLYDPRALLALVSAITMILQWSVPSPCCLPLRYTYHGPRAGRLM